MSKEEKIILFTYTRANKKMRTLFSPILKVSEYSLSNLLKYWERKVYTQPTQAFEQV